MFNLKMCFYGSYKHNQTYLLNIAYTNTQGVEDVQNVLKEIRWKSAEHFAEICGKSFHIDPYERERKVGSHREKNKHQDE